MDSETRQKRRQARRKKFLQLLGGECENCGSKKNLHFDHIRPQAKTKPIARLLDSNEAKAMEELEKCQLLCKECHHQKTLQKSEYGKMSDHGTLWRYIKHKCRCEKCRERMSEYYYSRL